MGRELMRGIVAFACGGLMAFGVIVFLQYLVGMVSRLLIYFRLDRKPEEGVLLPKKERYNQKMESFAYAVNGLSDAFLAMSQPKQKLVSEEVGVLEQELTGKLCAGCDGCVVCWNENRMRSLGGIRALLHAVMNHSTKEELMLDPYVENCHRYEGMVEEALQAFGRLELNQAWYNRLRENRYVIAQQLDAMAGLVEEWAKVRTNIDQKSKLLLSQIIFQVQEKAKPF